jgi:hypothetical protein
MDGIARQPAALGFQRHLHTRPDTIADGERIPGLVEKKDVVARRLLRAGGSASDKEDNGRSGHHPALFIPERERGGGFHRSAAEDEGFEHRASSNYGVSLCYLNADFAYLQDRRLE